MRALQAIGLNESAAMLRVVGMLRSELEYARDPAPTELEGLIARTREASLSATDEANRSFFRQHGTIVWSH